MTKSELNKSLPAMAHYLLGRAFAEQSSMYHLPGIIYPFTQSCGRLITQLNCGFAVNPLFRQTFRRRDVIFLCPFHILSIYLDLYVFQVVSHFLTSKNFSARIRLSQKICEWNEPPLELGFLSTLSLLLAQPTSHDI